MSALTAQKKRRHKRYEVCDDDGAASQIRTGDLILTKENRNELRLGALYLLLQTIEISRIIRAVQYSTFFFYAFL